MTAVALSIAALALLLAGFALAYARRNAHESGAREQGAQERELLLGALLDASPLAFVLCAETGEIVFDNASARRLFFAGRSGAGENFLQLVDAGPAPIRAALLAPGDEIVSLTVEGRRETYHVTRRTLSHRGALHTLLIVRPMTREVARHDLEVLKNVVRVLSHEVNNSLAPISSLVHSARRILASGERFSLLERAFDTIEERTQHLARFIAGYARLARLPLPTPTHVHWSVLCARLSALFPEACIETPAEALGFCDEGLLEQALINLLRNADEAGGPAHEVRLEVTSLADAATELRVLDRGAGFTPEALESALLPFFTTKAAGSGVGLALVREVVEAHAGQVTLGGREGGGAWVMLWLPGARRPPDDERARLTLTRG